MYVSTDVATPTAISRWDCMYTVKTHLHCTSRHARDTYTHHRSLTRVSQWCHQRSS